MLEELGSPRLGQSSLYEFMPVFQIGPEAHAPGAAGRNIGTVEERGADDDLRSRPPS